MSQWAATEPNLSVVLEALDKFILMLKGDNWLLHSNEEDIQSVIKCGKSVENIFDQVETTGLDREFERAVSDWLISRGNRQVVTVKQLREACNTVLEKALTKPGIKTTRVLSFVEAFLAVCGEKRLEEIISSVIFRCDIYRVLLCYVACSSNKLKPDIAISLQTFIVKKLWKGEKDPPHLNGMISEWLLNEENNFRIAVALFVAVESVKVHPWSIIHTTVENNLITILKERQAPAVHFWTTLKEIPKTSGTLEVFPQLFQTCLHFLAISGEWMEAQENLEWKSRERGPLGLAGYELLVSSLQCLLHCNGIVAERANEFLLERQNAPGCTLWDDVQLALQ